MYQTVGGTQEPIFETLRNKPIHAPKTRGVSHEIFTPQMAREWMVWRQYLETSTAGGVDYFDKGNGGQEGSKPAGQ
jgi:hypothetical protein